RHVEQVRLHLDELTTWKVGLVEVKWQTRFKIIGDLYCERTGDERDFALVTVRFEARSAMLGTLEDRVRPAENFLSEEASGFIRGDNNTVALIQPHKPVELTLVFQVPNDQSRAELLFYDCRPVPVTLPNRRLID